MSQIEDIVDVIIALGARPITQAGFETPLFISSHDLWEDRFRVYTSTQGATDDGFDSKSPVVLALNAFFSQTFRPSTVVVGRRDFDAQIVTVDAAVPGLGDVYSFDVVHRTGSLNARETVSFTATASETTSDLLATALAAVVTTATSGAVTATATNSIITLALGTATTLVLVDDTTANLTAGKTNLETVATAYAAINAVYTDFFFLTSDSQLDADIKELAAIAEANKKVSAYSQYDADIYSAGSTTDTPSELKTLGYDNTLGMSLIEMADQEEFQGCAAIGSMASIVPGASVLHGKKLKGATAGKFTDTQVAVAAGKNANLHADIAGGGFLLHGRMASGQSFDITRGILWLEARMQEALFLLIANKSNLGQKIPGDDEGIAMVSATMSQVLDTAVRNGLLSSYFINAPSRDEISTGDLTNRFLPDVPFTATLTGAFETITIRGYVSI